ncbi:protein kinase domain-containing protein [Streptomyces sp. NBC_01264]|uniref:protein kinase domain-containing protein n=1 Tax=Streptomyces sp. NBC_01264 TaxID=2903804 RepID=UPI002257DBE9|nr:protein kinase [Streptomyces sp. NBC_01264]MCX4775620.1 protein kinase [Streptomyces sp. NBC_01264]
MSGRRLGRPRLPLTSSGQVKVVDFGIARVLSNTIGGAETSQLRPAGTPAFGAPEQFHSLQGDSRSDLYALGAVLFTMLAGQAPFTADSALIIMQRKQVEDAPRLGVFRPDLPAEVAHLVDEL